MTSFSAEPVPPGSTQRRWRNLLLDKPFQLKFMGYSVASALLATILLGGFLWQTSKALMQETAAAVEARSQAAEQSRELGNAVLTSEVFGHLKDPAFQARFEQRSREIDQKFEDEKNAIVGQRAKLVRHQTVIWVVLLGSLLAFVALVALFSIVATHRIAGPLLRIRRLVDEVAQGRLREPTQSLREKDELHELFDACAAMVTALRSHDAATLELLERARRDPAQARAELEALAARLRTRIG